MRDQFKYRVLKSEQVARIGLHDYQRQYLSQMSNNINYIYKSLIREFSEVQLQVFWPVHSVKEK